jgi:hypothetical protein
MQAKPWYLSKTILANVIMGLGLAVGSFVPGVSEFVQNHFAVTGDAWAIVNIALRLITKSEIA